MKRLTDFIVNKSKFLLVGFIVLAVVGFLVSLKVPINYELSEYLPSDSETKIGLDVMQREFDDNISTLNVLFSNLPKSDQELIYKELSELDGVTAVEPAKNQGYGESNYTLYVVTVGAAKDSKRAASVYNEILDKYEDYEPDTGGEVSDYNKPLLPTWIVVLAVVSALVILIIMCNSYIEPFLFLFTILIGISLNSGTNIIFPSISNITNSIFPILQMALSMDYSIMLAHRYANERRKFADKKDAMKQALSKSLTAILASSVTTIVGLLALVFMNFAIGKDLGFVLAKGVFFCLFSILVCMPGLLLIFDNLIQKTQKRSPRFPVQALGTLQYKMRFISLPLFIAIFIICFLLKGNLGTSYSLDDSGRDSQIFTLNNQIAVIYESADDEKVAEYCKELRGDEKVKKVLCYGTTINEKLTYSELVKQMQEMGGELTVDENFLKIIYYRYHRPAEKERMALNEFIHFVKTEIADNALLADKVDGSDLDKIDKATEFINPSEFNKKKTSGELAKTFAIDKNLVDDLVIYQNAGNVATRMQITELINFVNNELPGTKYANYITADARQQLATAAKYANPTTINTALGYQDMARLFGMSEKDMRELYIYHILVGGTNRRVGLQEFSAMLKNPRLIEQKYCVSKKRLTPLELVQFILSRKDDRILSRKLDGATLNQLATLNNLMLSVQNGTRYSAAELVNIFGIDAEKMQLLYSLYEIKHLQKTILLSNRDFVNSVLNVAQNSEYGSQIDAGQLAQLKTLQRLMNEAAAGKTYDKNEMFKLLKSLGGEISQNDLDLLYTYYGSIKNYDDSYTMTLEELVAFLNDKILPDKRFASFINDEQRTSLEDAKSMIAEAKRQLVGDKYSRMILSTHYATESPETFAFVQKIKDDLGQHVDSEFYVIGSSPMSYEISQTFDDEMTLITILTMVFIFVVVLFMFKSISIPAVLVLLIQCAVFLTMGIMSFWDDKIYFLALLIVQSILMGATIDYAILYTTYYLEFRQNLNKKEALIKSYKYSINTILSSSLILMLVTLVVGNFTTDATKKICLAISEGTFCSLILVLFLLPSLLAALDFLITRRNRKRNAQKVL